MKKRRLQIIAVIMITAVTLLFSSFGRVLDIDDRVLVHAMGIDFADGEYNVTLQVFTTQGMGSDTPVDVSQSNIQVISRKGKTVREAIDGCQYELGKEIFLGHLQLICFGNTVDFSNPEELFSFAIKDKNVFLGVKLCMTENTAEELMNVQLTRGTMSSENFTKVIDMGVKNCITVECRLIDFLSCINSPQYVAMPILTEEQSAESGGSQEQQGGQASGQGGGQEQNSRQEPVIKISGTALIKNGEVLDDYLTHSEASGTAWLMGKAKQYDMVIEYENRRLDVKVTNDGRKIKLENKNGELIYKADITVLAHASMDVRTEEDSEKIAKLVNEQLKDYFYSAWDKTVKQNGEDIFGIWKMLRHQYPKSYMEYEDRLDEIYSAVKLNANIKCRVE